MADDASSTTVFIAHPVDRDLDRDAQRLARGLERLQTLHEEMAMRHALLSTGMDRLEGLRQTMIRQLDAITPDADLEPSLGQPEYKAHAWRDHRGLFVQPCLGATDDREVAEDDEKTLGWESHGAQVSLFRGEDDQEPALGWPERIDQASHRKSVTDHDDEPSLASVGNASAIYDQRWWGDGSPEDREHDTADSEYSLGAHEGPQGTVWAGPSDDLEPSLGSVICHHDQTHWANHHAPEDEHRASFDYEEQCEDEGAQCEDEGAQCDDEGDIEGI